METERATKSVDILMYGRSSMSVIALFSVTALVAVTVYEIRNANIRAVPRAGITAQAAAGNGTPFENAADPLVFAPTGTATTTLSDVVFNTLATEYVSLKNQGAYTPEAARRIGEGLAQELRAPIGYKTYAITDIKTDSDTSYARMLAYRDDLKISFAPLMKIDQPEFEIFGQYVQTNDESYLRKLRTVAGYYRTVAEDTVKITAPADALVYHLGVINAMSQFAATLDAMADNATDPFAAAALLQNYNDAEANVRFAFDALIAYEQNKRPS